MIEIVKKLVHVYQRKKWAKALDSIKKKGEGIKINNRCLFNSNTEIGDNCHFNGMTISGNGRVVIGDNFHSGMECLVMTENHNYDKGNALPYDNTYIVKEVIIEKNVWIGNRVIILPGSIIGEGAVIQAGSVVVGKIPKLAVCGGHPAKVIKYRDKEHYDTLEKQGKYT